MNWKSSAFLTLEDLNRNISLLKFGSFLDGELRSQLDSTLKEINKLCDPAYSYQNVSDKELKYLQDFFNKLLNNKINLKSLNEIEQCNIVKIICSMDKIYLNERPLSHSDNLGIVLSLIRRTGKQFADLIAGFFMKYYLTGSNYNREDIRKLVEKLFNRRSKQNKYYISDIQLYTNKYYFFSKINTNEKSYRAFLEKLGILPDFIKTDYFNYLFIKWLIKNNDYSEEVFNLNTEYFRILTVDEKKIALAGLICNLYEGLSINEFETKFSKFNSLLYIETNLNKTEKEFWNIVNKELITNDVTYLLNRAYEISVIIFSRDIITQFFDILGEDDYVTKQRAEFWRGYCISKSFKSIKVVLNENQKRALLSRIRIDNKRSIDNFIIDNDSKGINESPALIISFYQKTIIEFTKVGNASQVYNTNESYINNILLRRNIESTSKLKYYTEGLSNSIGTGRIIHNDGWLKRTKDFLEMFGIE